MVIRKFQNYVGYQVHLQSAKCPVWGINLKVMWPGLHTHTTNMVAQDSTLRREPQTCVSCSVVVGLKFSIILSLSLCFMSQSQGTMKHVLGSWSLESHNVSSPAICPPPLNESLAWLTHQPVMGAAIHSWRGPGRRRRRIRAHHRVVVKHPSCSVSILMLKETWH